MAQRVRLNPAVRLFRRRNGPLLAVLLTVTATAAFILLCNLHKDSTLAQVRQDAWSFTNTQLLSSFFTPNMPKKAPGKKELGNAGWTLIHSIAANYPESPSESEQYHAKAFLRSIAKLYPCKTCRRHFEKYLASSPPELASREQFMLWTCAAHNSVNERQGKDVFPCDMTAMEARWGDCGCKKRSKSVK